MNAPWGSGVQKSCLFASILEPERAQHNLPGQPPAGRASGGEPVLCGGILHLPKLGAREFPGPEGTHAGWLRAPETPRSALKVSCSLGPAHCSLPPASKSLSSWPARLFPPSSSNLASLCPLPRPKPVPEVPACTSPGVFEALAVSENQTRLRSRWPRRWREPLAAHRVLGRCLVGAGTSPGDLPGHPHPPGRRSLSVHGYFGALSHARWTGFLSRPDSATRGVMSGRERLRGHLCSAQDWSGAQWVGFGPRPAPQQGAKSILTGHLLGDPWALPRRLSPCTYLVSARRERGRQQGCFSSAGLQGPGEASLGQLWPLRLPDGGLGP